MSNRYQHVCITDEGAARLMYASLEGSDVEGYHFERI
jgi:hypothetical protein